MELDGGVYSSGELKILIMNSHRGEYSSVENYHVMTSFYILEG